MNFDELQGWAQVGLPVLMDATLKGAALLATAGVAAAALRRSSAAVRQIVWVSALVAMLALPVVSVCLPAWQVLPNWARIDLAAAAPETSPSDNWRAPEGSQMPPAVETPVWTPSAAPFAYGVTMPGGPGPDISTFASTQEAGAPGSQVMGASGFPATRSLLWSRFAPWALVLWMAGTLVCLLPLVLGRMSLWRLAKSARQIGVSNGAAAADDADGWPALASRAARAVGLRRNVAILQSDAESMPMVWGVVRPKLLLPAEADGWPTARRWVVLLHELAHARRNDCLAKLIAHVACAVYWFNPLCWVAFKRMQAEAEAACDDLVLVSGQRPSDYASHLLEMASGLRSGMLTAYSSIAMARRRQIEGRLLAILDTRRSRRRLTGLVLLAAAGVAAAVVLPLSMLGASKSDKAGEPAAATSTAAAVTATDKTGAASAADAELDRAMTLFNSTVPARRAEGIALLRAAGLASLEAWRRGYIDHTQQVGYSFEQEVLPYLPEAETKAWLLKEFHRSLPAARKRERLWTQHKDGTPWTPEEIAEYQRLTPEAMWWTTLSLIPPKGGYDPTHVYMVIITSYDEAMALLKSPDLVSVYSVIHTLIQLDRARAEADFARMAESPDDATLRLGLSGYGALKQLPPPAVWRRAVQHKDPDVLLGVAGLVGWARRDQVDMLLPLLTHSNLHVRSNAGWRLQELSWLTVRQMDQLVDRKAKPEDCQAFWQKWWTEHKDSGEEVLREAGLKATIAEFEEDATCMIFLRHPFHDRPELVPVLAKRLDPDNPKIRKLVADKVKDWARQPEPGEIEDLTAYYQQATADQLMFMTGPALAPAQEVLLTYAAKAKPGYVERMSGYLGQTKDPRATALLVKLIDGGILPGNFYNDRSTPMSERRTLGPEGDKKALDLALRIFGERIDETVPSVISRIPGAEAVVPRLLEMYMASMSEPPARTAFALSHPYLIRQSILSIGEGRLGPELTRLLAAAKPGSAQERVALDLLKEVPDPAAKPLLIQRLKSDDITVHILAAWALGQLGDYSGADTLLEDLKKGWTMEALAKTPWQMGQALKATGAPDLPARLEKMYAAAADKDAAARILQAILALEDPATLGFFEKLLDSPDPTTARTALEGMRWAIAGQQYSALPRSISKEMLEAIRRLFVYREFNEKLRPDDPPFKHLPTLEPHDPIYLTVGYLQSLKFSVKDRSLAVTKDWLRLDPAERMSDDDPADTVDVRIARHPVADGGLSWFQQNQYLLILLQTPKTYSTLYLFKFDGRVWQPLRLATDTGYRMSPPALCLPWLRGGPMTPPGSTVTITPAAATSSASPADAPVIAADKRDRALCDEYTARILAASQKNDKEAIAALTNDFNRTRLGGRLLQATVLKRNDADVAETLLQRSYGPRVMPAIKIQYRGNDNLHVTHIKDQGGEDCVVVETIPVNGKFLNGLHVRLFLEVLDANAADSPAGDAGKPADPKAAELAARVEALVSQLGAKESKARDEAQQKLLALARTDKIREVLVKHAKDEDPEIRLRVMKVLEEFQWGTPVDGLSLRLSLHGGNRPLHAGERITIDLQVRNLGTKAATLTCAQCFGPLLVVRDAEGRQFTSKRAWSDFPVSPPPLTTFTVQPGATATPLVSIDVQLDSQPVEKNEIDHVFLKPGLYRISQMWRFGPKDSTWTGELTSGDLEIAVENAAPPAPPAPAAR
jgi:beta-lactamase regulating signal transducer with metallopeptidase domain